MIKYYIQIIRSLYFSILILILWIIINSSHPIFIALILIIYRTLICLNISKWRKNFIYSIILFIIIISGLLIIFLYFSSLISNEQIILFLNINLIYLFFINLILFLILYINKNFLINLYFSISKEINQFININNKPFNNIINLYNYPFNNLTILCIIFLLISLFSIIKLCSTKSSPIRKISYGKKFN